MRETEKNQNDLNQLYETNRQAFLNGTMSETAWKDYCTKLLETLMANHKDIFDRLKMI